LKLSLKSVENFLAGIYKEFKTRDAYPLLVMVAPVIFLIIADPNSFSFIWFWQREVGRAGFVFIFFLVAWDFHDSRNKFKMTKSKWRYALAGFVLAALLVYYFLSVFFTDVVRVFVTSQLGVSQDSTLSFLLALEFILYALYCVAITAILYSPSATLLMVTPVIYAFGSGILDLMDAYFPQDSLAFLQVWVYVIWNVVVFILALTGYHTTINLATGSQSPPSLLLLGNKLYLWGFRGFMTLAIFWPSSGVVSMIVYSLVIVVLMVKLDAPRKRKIMYALVGAAGTYFVNVIRITLIVLYVTYVSLDVETFHQSIGEVLFIIWIFVYLLLVIHVENKRFHQPTTKVREKAQTRKRPDLAYSTKQSTHKTRFEESPVPQLKNPRNTPKKREQRERTF
jgi:thaumarchaeosortase